MEQHEEGTRDSQAVAEGRQKNSERNAQQVAPLAATVGSSDKTG